MDPSIWFTMVGDNVLRQTRNTACSINIIPSRSNTDIRRNFFSQRVVATWNALPTEVKESRTVKILKSKLEEIVI